jgi:hypothetical protein
VVAHPVLGIATVQGAFVFVVAVDAQAKHRIFAPSVEANARLAVKVAWRVIRGGSALARTVDRVAGIDRAIVVVVAVDAIAKARRFAQTPSADAREAVQAADGVVPDCRVAAGSGIEITRVVGTIVEVVTILGSFADGGASGSPVSTVAARSARSLAIAATAFERHGHEQQDRASKDKIVSRAFH